MSISTLFHTVVLLIVATSNASILILVLTAASSSGFVITYLPLTVLSLLVIPFSFCANIWRKPHWMWKPRPMQVRHLVALTLLWLINFVASILYTVRFISMAGGDLCKDFRALDLHQDCSAGTAVLILSWIASMIALAETIYAGFDFSEQEASTAPSTVYWRADMIQMKNIEPARPGAIRPTEEAAPLHRCDCRAWNDSVSF